jgi:hypothetical protein
MKIKITPSGKNVIIMIESEDDNRMIISWVVKEKDLLNLSKELNDAASCVFNKMNVNTGVAGE